MAENLAVGACGGAGLGQPQLINGSSSQMAKVMAQYEFGADGR
ncbi:hypothetical protein [Mesorhizobium sp. LMG 17147]|nr:hypothetical protein [Mesorhizobium sp. LMG 17147]